MQILAKTALDKERMDGSSPFHQNDDINESTHLLQSCASYERVASVVTVLSKVTSLQTVRHSVSVFSVSGTQTTFQ